MGCSAAKNVTVEPFDSTKTNGINANGNKSSKQRKISLPTKDIPDIVGEEPQTETIENVTVNNVHKTPHGLSFEITFEGEDGDSLIKKHPPQRIQRLEEQQVHAPTTLDQLQEKLEEAEGRRQQILNQRIQSAKQQRNHLRKQSTVSSEFEDDEMDYLKVPREEISTPPTFQRNESLVRHI